jgi:hypothetical protein
VKYPHGRSFRLSAADNRKLDVWCETLGMSPSSLMRLLLHKATPAIVHEMEGNLKAALKGKSRERK